MFGKVVFGLNSRGTIAQSYRAAKSGCYETCCQAASCTMFHPRGGWTSKARDIAKSMPCDKRGTTKRHRCSEQLASEEEFLYAKTYSFCLLFFSLVTVVCEVRIPAFCIESFHLSRLGCRSLVYTCNIKTVFSLPVFSNSATTTEPGVINGANCLFFALVMAHTLDHTL